MSRGNDQANGGDIEMGQDRVAPAPADAAADAPADAVAVAAVAAAKKAYLDGFKKRVQIFIEATVKMVCPVFLAVSVSLTTLDTESMEHRQVVRDIISPLAGSTLESSILSLLLISFAKSFTGKLFGLYIFSIHLCGVLLMVLAFLPLFLISNEKLNLLGFLVPVGVFTVTLAYNTVREGHKKHAEVYEKSGDELEKSVDFSAAVTFLLFVGLVGLMLGGQYKTIHGNVVEYKQALGFSVVMSFLACIGGMALMLVGMVPPVLNGRNDGFCDIINVLNNVLGGVLAAIVLAITLGTLRSPVAASFAFTLSGLPFMAWGLDCFGVSLVNREGTEQVKPASLDLTKVAFTGFLAIAVHTLSKGPGSIDGCAFWFIFLTAIAVNNGLGWRLCTHQENPSAPRFTAVYIASTWTRLFIAAAVIPFALMAFKALRATTTASPTPSPY